VARGRGRVGSGANAENIKTVVGFLWTGLRSGTLVLNLEITSIKITGGVVWGWVQTCYPRKTRIAKLAMDC